MERKRKPGEGAARKEIPEFLSVPGLKARIDHLSRLYPQLGESELARIFRLPAEGATILAPSEPSREES